MEAIHRVVQFRRVIQWILLALIGAFWAHTLWSQRDALAHYPWHMGWPYLAGAAGLLMGQMLLLATGWWRILHLLGVPLSWRTGSGMWLRAQIARYLPGGFWDILGRGWLGREVQVPLYAISSGALLEILLQLLAAAGFLLIAVHATLRGYVPFLVAGMGLLLVLLWPPVFQRILLWSARLLRRPPPSHISLSPRALFGLFLLYVAAHLCQGLGFVLFTRGIGGDKGVASVWLLVSYIGAWLVGYVAVFAPTGIGVREAALLLFLKGRLPISLVTAAALGYRVWLTLRDLGALLVGMLLWRGNG
ncbi:MAG: hypothetical protein GXO55_06540 [Chloroflexi bacterium]|nr:hypothetical protein [Chloroflexota bacterium]